MSTRNFSAHPSFGSYEHTARDTGELFVSPFVVAVFGIRQQRLGMDKLIGATNDGWDNMPVIELEDPMAPTGKVEILGAECWWTPINDETEEIPEILAEHPEEILPATTYIRTLESRLN